MKDINQTTERFRRTASRPEVPFKQDGWYADWISKLLDIVVLVAAVLALALVSWIGFAAGF